MRKWTPLVAISLGTFMLLLDITIVNVALPNLATDLGTGLSGLQWVIDVYALTLAALLLGAGSAADRLGRKRVYLVGLVVFALASLACALSTGSTMLIIARAVQGVGGAGMFATTIALLSSVYRGRDLGLAFGIWGSVNGFASAAGPIAGGLLTQHLGWEWIFLVNVPISVIAVVLTVLRVPESTGNQARTDVPGMVTFTLATAAVTYGLIRSTGDGWTSGIVLGSFAVSAVALVAFIVVERTRRDPMLDLKLFGSPSFTGVMIGAALLSGAAFGGLAYVSIWLQSVLDLSPIQAGLVFLPLSGAALVVSALAGRFLQDVAPRILIGVGTLLVGIGGLLMVVVNADSRWATLIAGLLVTGLGVGLALPIMSSAALAAAPRERGGMAGGALTTFRQLGLVLAIAVLGALFAGRVEDSLRDSGVPDPHRASGLLTGGQAGRLIGVVPPAQRAAVVDAVHAAFASGLRATFLAAGITGVVGAALVFGLVRGRSGHQQDGAGKDWSGESGTGPGPAADEPAAEPVGH
jgi:EmrB/QacA subfamily drug resistance transporter